MGKVNPIYSTEIPFNICGIYKLTSPSGKVYIGQSLKVRKRLHIHKNNNTKSLAYPIGRAIRKYGFENFDVELIISFKPTKDRAYNVSLLNHMETFCIKKYDSVNKGYNLTYGGDAKEMITEEHRIKLSKAAKGRKATEEQRARLRGRKISEEQREAARKRMTGMKLEGVWLEKVIACNKKKRKPVDQYTLDGVYIKTYESARAASIDLNIGFKGISRICNREYKRKSYCGFIWRFSGEHLGEFRVKDIRVSVYQYDKNMNLISQYESLKDAEKSTNITAQQIGKCISGKRLTAGGFIWKGELCQV